MGPGARWGSISNLAPSQPRRDLAGWVLPSDWRSRWIWRLPAVTRTRRVDVVAANLSDNESGIRVITVSSVHWVLSFSGCVI